MCICQKWRINPVRQQKRCSWCGDDPLMRAYHDEEWGVPVHDDRTLFEFLILEGMQAGLSWSTILKRREQFRKSFAKFDPQQVARFTKQDEALLLNNPGVIRNKLKIASAIGNARAFCEVQEEYGSFDRYIWQFVDKVPQSQGWKSADLVPAETPLSKAMAKELKKRGFNFVGSTICYAFMQAVGMVNDHIQDCFRFRELQWTP